MIDLRIVLFLIHTSTDADEQKIEFYNSLDEFYSNCKS